MCNSYRLHVPVNVIGDVFSQAGRPLHFPDGQPDLPATDDIRIGDRAAVVRLDDATPQLTMTPWALKGPGGPPCSTSARTDDGSMDRHAVWSRPTALMAAGPALAGGSGMPWEGPLQQVVQSITGPVVQAVAVVAVVIFGVAVSVAMSESGSNLQRGLGIMFGLCIAFAASTFFLDIFGFAGGVEGA
jgi:type IV secretory pathway VirB2 component (pilin)